MNRRICSAVVIALSTAAAHQAAAQESAEKPAASANLEEVMVTAQRREQSLLEVPLAISALTADDLQSQGITHTSSLSSVVPNLQVNSGFGDAQPNFSLRGISVGNEYNTNQASPVGVYVDDEYLPFRSTHAMQLYDLERIEVVKGPQGTLFGRNTTGGAINFITKRPGLSATEGFVDLGYGRFNDVRAQMAFETTPVDDKFGVRVSVNYKDADGFIKNLYPGQDDGNSTESLAGRVALRFHPNESLDMDLKLSASGGDPTQAAVWQRGTGPNLTNPFTGYSREGLGFWTVESFRMDHNKTDQQGAVFTLRYNLNDQWDLTSLSSYGDASLTFGQDGASSPMSLLDTRYHSDFEWFNQELRFSYGGDRLNFQTGAYYGTDRNSTDNKYGFFFFAGPASALSIVQHFVQERASTALFAQGDYQLTDHLTLTLGGRYTWDDAEYRDGWAYLGDINYAPVAYTVGSADAPLPDKKADAGAESYRIALNYLTDAGHMFYVSLNHGYRAGTYSGQGYFSPDQIYLTKPEEVDAYEVGAKGRFFDSRLSATAAVFYYDYKDQQINEVVGAVGFLRNAGKSSVKGAELDLQADFNTAVSGRLSLGYLDATYDTLSLSGTVLDGNDLPFAPRFTANAGIDWTLGEIAAGSVKFSPSVSYTTRQWFSPFNDKVGNGYLKQSALTQVAANLSWERDNVSVRLWGTNLLNEEFYTYGLNLQESFGYDYLLPGPPRMYGIAARYNF